MLEVNFGQAKNYDGQVVQIIKYLPGMVTILVPGRVDPYAAVG